MARTTSAEVAAIIEVDSTISLTPFINTANVLVTKYCEEACADYTVAELTEIEKWLSAHFYCVRDPRTASEGVKGISVDYQNKIDLYLASSEYGQTAMMLDWNGGLAAVNARMKSGRPSSVGITWLGDEEDTIDEIAEE